MPNITAVGAAQPSWEWEAYFPAVYGVDDLPIDPYAPARHDIIYARGMKPESGNWWQELVHSTHGWAGGGTLSIQADLEQPAGFGRPLGRPALCLDSGAAGDAISTELNVAETVMMDLNEQGTLAAGAPSPSLGRVHWFGCQLQIREAGATPDRETGILMTPFRTVNRQAWITHAVGINNRGGWGFVGDGAGGWLAGSYGRTASPDIIQEWALPANNVTELNTFEFVTVARGQNRQAYTELWFNGARIMQETFASGTVLAPGAVVEEEARVMPVWRNEGDQGFFLTGGWVRMGRFLRDGTELTG